MREAASFNHLIIIYFRDSFLSETTGLAKYTLKIVNSTLPIKEQKSDLSSLIKYF